MKRKFTPELTSWAVAVGLFVLSLAIYVSRMAPSVVPGDPGEYQLIASRWGIGHPPGYGFYALLGNVFTHLVPLGTFAWRANFLSAVCGATIVVLAYGIGRTLGAMDGRPTNTLRGYASPVLGALALATGLDLWQHAIHANAHIVTAAIATLCVFCLLCWWRWGQGGLATSDRWLFFFCLVAGLSPVHHPLLVFAFPAYALFILAVRPTILREWLTLLKMVGCALLGLTAYLYYPIRCAVGAPPLPGPSDMHTWVGFVRVVTAQGLRGNLLGFSLGEIVRRAWDIRVPLGLQYTWPALCLAGLGLVVLWARRWRPALLLTGYLACIVLATINILQDAMAYLMGPMVIVGVLIGLGVDVALSWLDRWERRTWMVAGVTALVALLPLWSAVVNWTRMDLSDFDDANAWLHAVETRFGGQGQHVALLTEWERMTTVYYYQAVDGRTWDPQDVRFIPISAGTETPFLDAIDANLALGPVYLTAYRPEVIERYRLMPSGLFWQALPAWPRDLPAEASPVDVVAEDQFEIVGWRVNQDCAQPGDVLLVDLYMRMPDPEGVEAQQYYLPWVRMGETTYHFTTDSRFNTPWWQPGEIVVERFELPIAWGIAPGTYPLQVGVRLVNQGEDLDLRLDGQYVGTLATLGDLQIDPATWRPVQRTLDRAVGNLHGDLLLRQARVAGRRVPTERRMTLRLGRELPVVLKWESLRPIQENYTVFVQLLNAGLQVVSQQDTTPLGGSAPTLLWFPRWRRGMRFTDTYVLDVPPDLPAGQYPLVVGMYDFNTHKRVQVVSASGDVEGDWVTLVHLWVE